MEKNRKPDQYYEDLYDRMTIKELKQLEKESLVPIMSPAFKVANLLTVARDYDPTTPFYERAVWLAQNKKDTISDWKQEDEQKDRIISLYPPPIRSCAICKVRMVFHGLLFGNQEKEWLYIYDCPKNKKHRKVYYKNGDEYFIIRPSCKECGGELISKRRRTKYKIVCKDICSDCEKVTIEEFDLTPDKPIKEKDRKKYCKDFEGRLTFKQHMEKLLVTMEHIVSKQKENEDMMAIAKIETLTIFQLEQRLRPLIEKQKYSRLNFDHPEEGHFLLVGISMWDGSGRSEKEIIKELTRLIQKELFYTNWRLKASSITYQLGFITGKIKGFSNQDDLLKLAKEINTTSMP